MNNKTNGSKTTSKRLITLAVNVAILKYVWITSAKRLHYYYFSTILLYFTLYFTLYFFTLLLHYCYFWFLF